MFDKKVAHCRKSSQISVYKVLPVSQPCPITKLVLLKNCQPLICSVDAHVFFIKSITDITNLLEVENLI